MQQIDLSGEKRPFTIQLLGAPIITWQAAPFKLPRRQVRALLFRLAAEQQPVARDQLMTLFWPETAESNARRNLTRLFSTLRQALPDPEILQVTRSAASLNPNLTWSDTVTFVELTASNDAAKLEAAVALYRDTFLSGFFLSNSIDFDAWQSQQQYVYERRYLSTLASLVIAKRQAGKIAKAIDYAQHYLATDDLSERIHCQLIELYAQTGDRNAVLRQFERCVLVLERELGVSPLPETRAAYESARDGRQLAVPEKPPEPEWATLPSLDLPLIGREAAWKALKNAYGRFQQGGVIFISGEPGVGKSRLMQEFASVHIGLVIIGNSHADGRTIPYQPLIQALRQALSLPNRWQHAAPIWIAEASRLLPELPAAFPNLPPPVEVKPDQAQAHLFEALTQLFCALSTDSPLLLCLDDVHWADDATRSWLQYAMKRLAGSQICILATYRTHEATALREWRRTLGRANLMTDIRLDGLSETAVASLLRQAKDNLIEPERLATRIHTATGGNAFFVLETVRELLETNQLTNPPADLPLSSTVRETVLRRVGRLSPLTQQILEITAVLSPILTFPIINQTAGRNDLETANSLEELAAHQLLRADGDQFRFQHDLAREAVYQNISIWRRRLLHRRAANGLEDSPNQKDAGLAATIAAHFEAAGNIEQAIDYFQQAAAMTRYIYANQEAVYYYERALALLKDENSGGKLRLLVRLYQGLGQVLNRQAHYARAKQAYQSMRLAATKLDDPKMMAQAWLRLSQIQDSLKRYSDSLESAANAAQLSAKHRLDTTYAFAVYAQSWALFRLGKLDEALPIAKKALEQSTSLGYQDVMARSQNTLGAIYKYLGQYKLSEKHQQLALELFQQLGDRRRVAGMFNNLGETARLLQEYPKAVDFYQQAIEIAKQIGEKDWLVEFFSNLGFAQIKLEKHHDAEISLRQALDVAQAANSQVDASLYIELANVYIAQTRWSDAAACLTKGQHILVATGEKEKATKTAQLLSELNAK